MKKLLVVLSIVMLGLSSVADAKGGSSSGGGGHASSGGGGHSFSSGSSGSYGGSKSFSSGASSPSKGGFSSASRPSSTTTTRTVTSSRSSYSSSRGGYYGGGYIHPYGMYGGWGMGYGYSNGLLTGMIIADMMHPQGTVMYNGGGQYNNNALLYPNGQVVNQQGYQVGTYQNGQFVPMDNGPMVAQQVPQDAVQQQAPPPQPVIIQQSQSSINALDVVLVCFVMILFFVIIIGVFLS